MKSHSLFRILAFLTSSIFFGAVANAAEPTPIETLEMEQRLANAMAATDKVLINIENTVKNRELSCLKAFGHKSFCKCLSKDLLIFSSFDDYIIFSTRTKEELNYSVSEEEKKKLIDNVLNTREHCVKSAFK